jgi:hypothetical protein
MSNVIDDRTYRVGFFSDVDQAEQAVRKLLAAGFRQQQLAVICPAHFKDRCIANVPRAERPGFHATKALAEGGAVGAVLGGIALMAAGIATGGVGLLPAIPVLIGGGAIAGGFTNLIVSEGYGKEIGEYYEEAVRLEKIVVGVKAEGRGSEALLAQAEHILAEAAAHAPATN